MSILKKLNAWLRLRAESKRMKELKAISEWAGRQEEKLKSLEDEAHKGQEQIQLQLDRLEGLKRILQTPNMREVDSSSLGIKKITCFSLVLLLFLVCLWGLFFGTPVKDQSEIHGFFYWGMFLIVPYELYLLSLQFPTIGELLFRLKKYRRLLITISLLLNLCSLFFAISGIRHKVYIERVKSLHEFFQISDWSDLPEIHRLKSIDYWKTFVAKIRLCSSLEELSSTINQHLLEVKNTSFNDNMLDASLGADLAVFPLAKLGSDVINFDEEKNKIIKSVEDHIVSLEKQ
jgi:hypothetical protein